MSFAEEIRNNMVNDTERISQLKADVDFFADQTLKIWIDYHFEMLKQLIIEESLKSKKSTISGVLDIRAIWRELPQDFQKDLTKYGLLEKYLFFKRTPFNGEVYSINFNPFEYEYRVIKKERTVPVYGRLFKRKQTVLDNYQRSVIKPSEVFQKFLNGLYDLAKKEGISIDLSSLRDISELYAFKSINQAITIDECIENVNSSYRCFCSSNSCCYLDYDTELKIIKKLEEKYPSGKFCEKMLNSNSYTKEPHYFRHRLPDMSTICAKIDFSYKI